MPIGFWIAGFALTGAAMLYFIVLPIVEENEAEAGESPAAGEPPVDKREMLVCCDNCRNWQSAEPVASTANEPDKQGERVETNWFHCRHCNHRWSEKRLR